MVDNKKLQFTVAVDISYIDKEVQGWIYEYICDTGFIKPKQIAALRNQLNDGPINQIQMLSIFNNCVMAKKVSRSLTFSEKKLTKYFPDDYTAKDMTNTSMRQCRGHLQKMRQRKTVWRPFSTT